MKKIDWDKPILGGDGIERDREKIENFFTDLFETTIMDNLKILFVIEHRERFQEYVDYILRNLPNILVYKPSELDNLKKEEDRRKQKWQHEDGIPEEDIKDFYKRIHKAFNYNGFRKNLLNQLAVVLNVKTCIYCNQQYTIALGKSLKDKVSLKGSKAFLQFDHFFGEKEYPIMSMSLYNLIPSCPCCNQKKSARHVSLRLHPYVSDLSSMLRFRIKDQAAFINPKFKDLDLLEVEIDTTEDEVKDFVERLDLKKRYARHLDIVQELEVALYMAPYYNGNFEDIRKIFGKDSGLDSERLRILQRHFKGFYMDPDNINKRPLTKFSQDIYAQLCSWQEGF